MSPRAPRFTARALPLLGLLGLSTAGCGMLDAQLEARTVCFTLPDYPIPAAIVPGTLATDIAYDLGSDLPIVSQEGVSYSLVLQRARFAVGAGSPAVDLGGIDRLAVSVMTPALASLPEPELVRYERGADAHPTTIEAASSSGTNLAPYVADGQVRFLVTAGGALPDHDWSADVTACFLLTVDVDYGEEL